MLCDQLVIVSEGAVLAQGTPDELRQRFAAHDLEDVFVASISQAAAGAA